MIVLEGSLNGESDMFGNKEIWIPDQVRDDEEIWICKIPLNPPLRKGDVCVTDSRLRLEMTQGRA